MSLQDFHLVMITANTKHFQSVNSSTHPSCMIYCSCSFCHERDVKSFQVKAKNYVRLCEDNCFTQKISLAISNKKKSTGISKTKQCQS